MDKIKGIAAAESGVEREQRCRQQMQRAGELCKRLLRRLDVAGASLRRALDGCRQGLQRLEDDKRLSAERLVAAEPQVAEPLSPPPSPPLAHEPVVPPRAQAKPRMSPAPPPPKARTKPRTSPPPPPQPKQKTPPQGRQPKPPARAQTKQAALLKQPSPPTPAKAAARTCARPARDVPARKNEKAKMSPQLLELKATTKAQPKKPTWKKFVPKPCKKALGD